MKTALFALVIGLQTAWVIGTVAVQEGRLTEGARILLETRPVDPRDLLRGDYVILSYDISRVPLAKFAPALTDGAAVGNGATVYVELQPEDRFHRVYRASLNPIQPEPGHVILRGTARPGWRGATTTAATAEVLVEYGLERYYVREGTGNPRGKLTVEVSVGRSGKGSIKQVFLDDVPYAEAMKGAR